MIGHVRALSLSLLFDGETRASSQREFETLLRVSLFLSSDFFFRSEVFTCGLIFLISRPCRIFERFRALETDF